MTDPHKIHELLSERKFPEAIRAAQDWLPGASYLAIQEVVRACPERVRPRLVCLIKDILSNHPATIFAAPVFVYYEPSFHCNPLPLPLPDVPPDESVVSVSWMTLGALTDGQPFYPRPEQVVARPYVTEIAVLVMRCKNSDAPEPSNEWFADLFRLPASENVTLSARLVAPYPEALEAGRVLLLNSRPRPMIDCPCIFLSPAGHAWAQAAGQQWVETLAARYPGTGPANTEDI